MSFKSYCCVSYPPGRVIGGGLVIVQFFGTFGLFSSDAIGLRGSKSKLLWWWPFTSTIIHKINKKYKINKLDYSVIILNSKILNSQLRQFFLDMFPVVSLFFGWYINCEWGERKNNMNIGQMYTILYTISYVCNYTYNWNCHIYVHHFVPLWKVQICCIGHIYTVGLNGPSSTFKALRITISIKISKIAIRSPSWCWWLTLDSNYWQSIKFGG